MAGWEHEVAQLAGHLWEKAWGWLVAGGAAGVALKAWDPVRKTVLARWQRRKDRRERARRWPRFEQYRKTVGSFGVYPPPSAGQVAAHLRAREEHDDLADALVLGHIRKPDGYSRAVDNVQDIPFTPWRDLQRKREAEAQDKTPDG